MNTKEHALSREVLQIVEQIKPLLAGHPPVVQSAVLAELLGLLLAGHWIPGEPAQNTFVRRSLLATHCSLAWELCEVNAKMMGTDT